MSDHEFEKQVRQKLNQLNLTPSAKAWENIEETLKERHRRSSPVLWLSLLLLGLAAGGFLLYHQGAKTSAETNKLFAKTGQQAPSGGKNSSDLQPKIPSGTNNNDHQQPNTPSVNEDVDAAANDMPLSKGGPNTAYTLPGTTDKGRPGDIRRSSPTAAEKASRILNSGNKVIPVAGNRADAVMYPEKSTDDHTGAGINKDEDKLSFSRVRPAGTDQRQMKKQDISLYQPPAHGLKINSGNPVSFPKKADRKKISKWSFAVSAYSGVVAVNKGNILNFSNSKVEDVSNAVTPARTSNFGRATYTPSSIYPGFAFSLGGLVKLDVSKRFSLSSGLSYTQFNTLSKVGQRINGNQVVNNGPAGYLYVQNYYLLDEPQTTVYKNRYHFLELPVNVHYRLNKSQKLPLFLNGGLVVSELTQSNSLHFDGTTGVYYKNDRLINQTQIGVTTGISFAVFSKSATPLWIGPSVRSNISTILSKDIAANKHFITLGLDLKLFLK